MAIRTVRVDRDSDLEALADNTSNGLWVRTGSGTGAARSIAASGNGISVANGDGVSANPTVSLNTQLAQFSVASLPDNGYLQKQDEEANGFISVSPLLMRGVASLADYAATPTALVGDGSTNEAAVITAAEAATAKKMAVPDGKIVRTATLGFGTQLTKTYVGPGQVECGDGNWLPPSWRVISSPPDQGDFNYILTAANSDDAQKVQDWAGTWVTGATTAGQPTTGYVTNYETATSLKYYFVSNDAGYNYDTDTNDGRTALIADTIFVTQAGNGDAMARWASVYVSGARSAGVGGPGTPTDALAMPAGALMAGQVLAGANDVYLNNVEINAVDNGYRASAGVMILNMERTVAGGVNNEFWIGCAPQSIGSVACDSAFRPSGKWNQILDMSNVDLGANNAAIVMKEGHRIYGDGSISDAAFDRFCDNLGQAYFEYDTSNGWMFSQGNTPVGQINSGEIYSYGRFDCAEHYQVDGTQVVTNRVTGFTTAAGSANKNASGIDVGTITASDANIRALSAWVKALHDALATHGLIGS